MQFDERKIDDAALALLYLTLHDGNRSWKTLDWETMNRLHRGSSSPTPPAAPSPSPSPMTASPSPNNSPKPSSPNNRGFPSCLLSLCWIVECLAVQETLASRDIISCDARKQPRFAAPIRRIQTLRARSRPRRTYTFFSLFFR